MKKLIIDRFEGIYAICESPDRESFAIPVKELPKEAKAGSVLLITDEGELTLSSDETDFRKERLGEMQKDLFSKK